MSDAANPQVSEPETLPVVEEQIAESAAGAAETVEDTAESAAEEIASVQDRLIDTVTASQQDAIDTVESASQAMLDVLTRARTEISDFVAERIRQDIDVQKALLQCRSIGEVRDVQAKFVRTAIDQYGGEAAKLVRMSGEVATKSFERARA